MTRPPLREQLKARNRQLSHQRAVDALLAPEPSPWTPDFGANGAGEATNGATSVPDAMKAGVVPTLPSPMTRLMQKGFRLHAPRSRPSMSVRLYPDKIYLNLGARHALGDPKRVHVLISTCCLAVVPATDDTVPSYKITGNQISASRLTQSLVAAGIAAKLYAARLEDGALIITLERVP